MGLLKILFVILLLLFPLGQITRLELQNSIAINLSDVVVGLLIVVFLFINRSKKEFKRYLTTPIIIFSLICLLSLIINMSSLNFSEFIISFLYLVRWIFYASLFFVVSGFDIRFKKIIAKTMVLIGGLVVVGGYLQYFLYPSLRNLYYLGWDEHMYRMFSSFLDPNFAGAFFVLFLIFSIGILIYSFSQKTSKLKILGIGIITFLTLGAIYLTFSRSAFLMLFTGVFIELAFFGKIRWIFLLAGISAIVFLITYKNFYVENINPFRIVSTGARLTSAKEAIAIFEKNPSLGVGFNTYRYYQIRYGLRNEIGAKISHADAGADNSFLFVLATTGIVGFTFYLFMWVKILKSCHPDTKKGGFQKTISIVVTASSIGIFVDSMFINSLFYPSIMLWMWVLIGLLDNS